MATTMTWAPTKASKNAVQPGASKSSSATTYADPTLASTIAQGGAANTATASKSLLDLLGDPTASSAYQTTLKGMLADMQPSIDQGYSDLSDAFRKAGAQQSGAYGSSLAQYASGVERNQLGAAADAMKAILPSLVSGYSGMATQTPSLMEALKVSQSNSASQAYDPNAANKNSAMGMRQTLPSASGNTQGRIGYTVGGGY